jgi:hypothetical protein
VVILVEVDGKEVVMIFITNNTERAASNIGELYQARWQGQAADWSHSFSRLLTVVRGVVRDKIDLAALLKSYGTAGGIYRHVSTGFYATRLWDSMWEKLMPYRIRPRITQNPNSEKKP